MFRDMMGKKIRELDGANMDIDFIAADVSWKQARCPWNEAEGRDCHKCAVKGISICDYFEGIKDDDVVLCSWEGDGEVDRII